MNLGSIVSENYIISMENICILSKIYPQECEDCPVSEGVCLPLLWTVPLKTLMVLCQTEKL